MTFNPNESRIDELKKMRDESLFTSEDRDLFDAGLALLEQHWTDRKQAAYDDALERHTAQHERVWKQLNSGVVEMKELTSYLKRRRGDKEKAKVVFRDKDAEYRRLYDQHDALLDARKEMDRQYMLSPAAYQAEVTGRMPAARASSMTIGRAINLAAREDD